MILTSQTIPLENPDRRHVDVSGYDVSGILGRGYMDGRGG